MSRIRVQFQIEKHPSGHDIDVAMNLDELQAMDVIRQLDFPSSSLGVFCTDPVTIRRTLGERTRVAKLITKAIMDSLGDRDLVDGYPKEHREEGRTA